MNFYPKPSSVRTLLQSKKQLVIPRFQREYSWDRINYKEFLYDLLSNITYERNKIVPNQYFLGTMLFAGDFEDINSESVEVIDGQQRLTTITILFSVLSDILKKIGQEKLSDGIFQYIQFKNEDRVEMPIIKTKTSHPYFADFIQSYEKEKEIVISKDNYEENNIRQTYLFFYNELSENILMNNEKVSNKYEYVDILKAIRDVTLNCSIISITTKDKKEGNKLFEILNAKGKPLAQMDLIKNLIFTELNKTEPSDKAFNAWEKIKDNLIINDEIITLEDFYRHFWMASRGKIGKKILYDKFKSGIAKDKYMPFLKELLDNSVYYRNIIENRISKKKRWKNNALDVFNKYFNLRQVRIILITLNYLEEKKMITNKNLKEIYDVLESFHFSYTMLMHNTSNKLETIYTDFSLKLRGVCNKNEINGLTKEYLIKKLKDLLPTKDQFFEQFKKIKYSSKLKLDTNITAKYVVYKMNLFFSENESFDINGSIEHIINEDINKEITLNIGNLILLEESINNNIGNASVDEKLVMYKKSQYKEVQKFVKKYKTFGETDIMNRSDELSEYFYKKIIKNFN